MHPSLDFEVRLPARQPFPAGAADDGTGSHAALAPPDAVDCGRLASMLDEIDYGAMLLDAGATVCFANSHAYAACAADEPLQIVGGRVLPRRDAERGPFLDALRAAGDGRRSMLQLRRGDSGQPLALAIVPLGATSAPHERPVLMLSGRRQSCERLTLQFYALANGLTDAETAVLAGLCRGLRPTEIARERGTLLTTVRSHVGSVRQKTGSASIGEVVRRVAMLPPMVGALRGLPPQAGRPG